MGGRASEDGMLYSSLIKKHSKQVFTVEQAHRLCIDGRAPSPDIEGYMP